MPIPSQRAAACFLAFLVAPVTPALSAQLTGPGLVVPSPAAERVAVHADSFHAAGGAWRPYAVYRPAGVSGRLPVVLFANGSNADFTSWRGYVEWARLVTARGLAAVLYQGPEFDGGRSLEENLATSVSDLDSLTTTIARRGAELAIDPDNVVVWAGSAQTFTGTPFALTGNRPGVRGYVLYYGAGSAEQPRLDVPTLIVRAGLDSPGLNRGLDSLARHLTLTGVPVTVLSHPSGPHGFDVLDSTESSARAITQTLDFMSLALDPRYQAAVRRGAPAARASSAFAAGRWDEAERLYLGLLRTSPGDRIVAWRLGLAQLEAGHPAAALASLDRARELGQGGARDLGLPAARAALRSGATGRAREWVAWALEKFPRIRAEIEADRELAGLLD